MRRYVDVRTHVDYRSFTSLSRALLLKQVENVKSRNETIKSIIVKNKVDCYSQDYFVKLLRTKLTATHKLCTNKSCAQSPHVSKSQDYTKHGKS